LRIKRANLVWGSVVLIEVIVICLLRVIVGGENWVVVDVVVGLDVVQHVPSVEQHRDPAETVGQEHW